jgi:hypothetical protein
VKPANVLSRGPGESPTSASPRCGRRRLTRTGTVMGTARACARTGQRAPTTPPRRLKPGCSCSSRWSATHRSAARPDIAAMAFHHVGARHPRRAARGLAGPRDADPPLPRPRRPEASSGRPRQCAPPRPRPPRPHRLASAAGGAPQVGPTHPSSHGGFCPTGPTQPHWPVPAPPPAPARGSGATALGWLWAPVTLVATAGGVLGTRWSATAVVQRRQWRRRAAPPTASGVLT